MGSLVNLELCMNSDGTNGQLLLYRPDASKPPIVVADKLSGEYVWVAVMDTPGMWTDRQMRRSHCGMSIGEG